MNPASTNSRVGSRGFRTWMDGAHLSVTDPLLTCGNALTVVLIGPAGEVTQRSDTTLQVHEVGLQERFSGV